jgi:hypothetical protein
MGDVEMSSEYEEKLKSKLEKRHQILEKPAKEKDCDYITKVMYDILGMAISVNQVEVPGEIKECKRLIHIRRPMPLEIVRISHPELIVFEGIYLVANGIAIPERDMRSIGYFKRGRGRVIDTSVLPSGFNYGLLRDNGDYGFTFSNDEVVSKYVGFSTGWELVDMLTYSEN